MTTTTKTLSTDLNTRPVREFLLPLIKQLGGLTVDVCRQFDAGAKHYSSMKRSPMVAAILHVYTEEQVLAAIETMGQSKTPASDVEMLAALVRKIANAGVDADQVRAILTEERSGIVLEAIEAAKAANVRTIEIKVADAPAVHVGVQHRNFEYLLKMASCRLGNGRRLNVWLHGPAGTGKTTAARKVAEALQLPFYYTGAIETSYAVMGYTDAHGKVVRTTFREAYENGGVFLFDEVDASHPQALAAINAAVDGDIAAFPDGMVARHTDFVMIAGANTVGKGGDAKYAGRVRQDEAFLSRWSPLEWPLDETLESHLAGNDDAATLMVRIVRDLRKAAAANRIDGASLTTRSILDGASMVRAGLPMDIVLAATCRKGMPLESWNRLTEGLKVD